MITTTFKNRDGKTVEHIGSCGFTVTGTPIDEHLCVYVDLDATTRELVTIVGSLLAQLESKIGDDFVVRCLDCYAKETGKEFHEESDGRKFVVLGSIPEQP